MLLNEIVEGFIEGWQSAGREPLGEIIREEKELRENLSEAQIDEMVKETFPASDPPSSY